MTATGMTATGMTETGMSETGMSETGMSETGTIAMTDSEAFSEHASRQTASLLS